MIDRGEWRFLSQYKHFVVSEAAWFSDMTAESKKKHLKNVFNYVPTVVSSSASDSLEGSSKKSTLSIGWENCNMSNIWRP